jgi:single-stranded-DNA-specific exonuclease
LIKDNIKLEPRIYYDFELKADAFTFDTLDQINSLEPFGREFEKPVFYNKFIVENIKFVGKDKNHAQLMLRLDNKTLKSIWFNAIDNSVSQNIVIGDEIKVCYELQKEEFMGNINISLNIKAVQK